MFSDFIILHLVAIRKGIIVVLGTCEQGRPAVASQRTERDLCVGTRGCPEAFPFYFEAAIEDTETYSSWGKQLACL